MKPLPKEFNIKEIEVKWQTLWEEEGVYRFDWEARDKPPYTIDTPPPYPSGDFHMGNVLNWTYFDIVARYKRMKGYNVHFPQGWDCHGLPTEVETEEKYGIRKTQVPPDEFRKLCEQFVEKYIQAMKKAIKRMGCSIDWSLEYKTMDPDYWRRTQLSFILLYQKGLIYQGTHPVNWCPRCETAIADAEVEYESRDGFFHYIRFPLEDGGFLSIATTRPELIPACVAVAVHPDDQRYNRFVNRTVVVPIVGSKVKIIFDDNVEPEFGTGVVMICTFGDKDDVRCVSKNKLPVITVLTEDGKMNENAGKYAGLGIEEARKAIVQDLQNEGFLEKIERIRQEVGVCWRCKTPVEILERKQWFMKTRALTDQVEKAAYEVKWYPNHMRHRLIDWARSLDWDWVISRQRVFATPIPIWYCEKCGEVILAKPEWLPIDPKLSPPKIEICPKCGSKKFLPEKDVLDTWFDSSITCAVHAGWPDRPDWRRLFPSDLHPSGTDIIRTWAYYLMVRHLALFGEKAYKACLINGMVLGSDGRKMSKSLGNYVTTLEVIEKYGADAMRQWAAAGGATGSDIPFRWPDVEYGWRFLIKLWNASRFASLHLKDYDPASKGRLQLIDRWLLSKLEKTVEKVGEALENYNFNIAIEAVREFTWHIFCDQYIEAIKDRLYRVESQDDESRAAALYTLYHAIYKIIQMLAPFTPHITEEIYQNMYAELKGYRSIHLTPWPEADRELINEEAERKGDIVIQMIAEIRRGKSERRFPLNAPIKKLTIYSEDKVFLEAIKEGKEAIMQACKIKELIIIFGKGGESQIKNYPQAGYTVEY
ncbi:MAG: valine--tRNA ligase [Nitrososphaerota archaeon]|nr:valine--tRNA ligase [Candidatus Bathyarchaeota archaeon]MDW8049318.1 valine--tRNA ligase [Nitrososphaerota archaeon]